MAPTRREILERFHNEGSAGKDVFITLDGAVREGLRAIAAIIYPIRTSLELGKAKVYEESMRLFQVGVGVVDMRNAQQLQFPDRCRHDLETRGN